MSSGSNIRLEGQGNDGLDNGREHKSPCPPGVGNVHSDFATGLWWEGGGEAFAVVVSSGLDPVGNLGGGLEGRLVGGVVVLEVVEAAIEGLSSQKGCARLVVRNFGKNGSREGRLAMGCINKCWRWRRESLAARGVTWQRRVGWATAGLDAQLRPI